VNNLPKVVTKLCPGSGFDLARNQLHVYLCQPHPSLSGFDSSFLASVTYLVDPVERVRTSHYMGVHMICTTAQSWSKISTLTLQTITIAQMLSVGGEGELVSVMRNKKSTLLTIFTYAWI